MILKPIKIRLRYDVVLQKITGRPSDPVILSEGAPFSYLLFNLFQSYPEIEQQYPPGTLGFTVNGQPPTDDTVLRDGDVVEFAVVEPPALKNPKEILLAEHQLRQELQQLVDRHQLAHSVDEIERLIFEERDAKDFTRYLDSVMKGATKPPTTHGELESALELLGRAWNELPHASLDGQSPAEFAAKLRTAALAKTPSKKSRRKGRRG